MYRSLFSSRRLLPGGDVIVSRLGHTGRSLRKQIPKVLACQQLSEFKGSHPVVWLLDKIVKAIDATCLPPSLSLLKTEVLPRIQTRLHATSPQIAMLSLAKRLLRILFFVALISSKTVRSRFAFLISSMPLFDTRSPLFLVRYSLCLTRR